LNHVAGDLGIPSESALRRIGISSPDAWAGIALYIYNLALNWFIILPIFFLFVLILTFLESTSTFIVFNVRNDFMSVSFAAIGLVCLIVAVGFTARNRPSRQVSSASTICDKSDKQNFLFRSLLWSVISAIALTLYVQTSRYYFPWPLPGSLSARYSARVFMPSPGWSTGRKDMIRAIS
jgi:hypothetical protein